VHPVRVLDQQVTEVGRRSVGGRHGEQHAHHAVSQHKRGRPCFGGPAAQLARRTVTGLTGVDLDAVVTLDWSAVRGVTDAVGGVTFCLPDRIRSEHTGRTYAAGCRPFDGAAAVDVLRQRYGLPAGPYDRDRNGQRYLRGLAERIGAQGVLTDPAKLDDVVDAAGDGVTVSAGGLGVLDVIGLAGAISTDDVVGIASPDYSSVHKGNAYQGERLYPTVGPSLFAALRDDAVGAWVTANPTYRTP
jgi:hypothetical protein